LWRRASTQTLRSSDARKLSTMPSPSINTLLLLPYPSKVPCCNYFEEAFSD